MAIVKHDTIENEFVILLSRNVFDNRLEENKKSELTRFSPLTLGSVVFSTKHSTRAHPLLSFNVFNSNGFLGTLTAR